MGSLLCIHTFWHATQIDVHVVCASALLLIDVVTCAFGAVCALVLDISENQYVWQQSSCESVIGKFHGISRMLMGRHCEASWKQSWSVG